MELSVSQEDPAEQKKDIFRLPFFIRTAVSQCLKKPFSCEHGMSPLVEEDTAGSTVEKEIKGWSERGGWRPGKRILQNSG